MNEPLYYIVATHATPNGGWADCSVNPHASLKSAESHLIQTPGAALYAVWPTETRLVRKGPRNWAESDTACEAAGMDRCADSRRLRHPDAA